MPWPFNASTTLFIIQLNWDWGYNHDPMLDTLRDREDFKNRVRQCH
jgi:hypothetical protein